MRTSWPNPPSPKSQAAADEAPLAYLLATSAGGLAVIVGSNTVQRVWLDSLTDRRVREWLRGPADEPAIGGWLGTYMNYLDASRNRLIERTLRAQRALLEAEQAWMDAIDDVTHQLWTHLLQPLAEALHQLKTCADSDAPLVTLIPSGLLALLPLHVAWTEDVSTLTGRRYFLDEFTVSYAPSALSLSHARERATSAHADRLLVIEKPLASGVERLPNVHDEVAAITGLFDMPVILAREKATNEAVRAALHEADVVHFSCHGSNNWQSPLDSGLLMADDETGNNVMLTVRDLLDLGLAGGRLATLSACETGIVGTNLPDEAVALPSALLQAGYGGVAASLWSVSDISAAMLMEHFYAGWRHKGEHQLSPAEALRAAQRWRGTQRTMKKPSTSSTTGKELSGVRMPEATAINFFNQAMSRDLDSRDFAHPFW